MKFSDAVMPLTIIALVAVGAYFVIENTMIQSQGESEEQVRVTSPIDTMADKVEGEDPEVETLREDIPASEEPSLVEESRTDIQSQGESEEQVRVASPIDTMADKVEGEDPEVETLREDTPASEEPSRLERGKEDGPVSLDLLSS